MNENQKLKNLVLAPYINKATALIGKERNVGGNQFRHALATMAILLDYKYFDNYILLKDRCRYGFGRRREDLCPYRRHTAEQDRNKVSP